MFCHNCGTQLDDGLKFCTKCGTKIERTAVQTGQQAAAQAAPTPIPSQNQPSERVSPQTVNQQSSGVLARYPMRYCENNGLRPFYIGEQRVSYSLWQEVYAWAINNGYLFQHPGKENKKLGYPAHISWRDIVVWCNALSEYAGKMPVYTLNGVTAKSSASKFLDTFTGKTVDEAECNFAANGYRLPLGEEWDIAAPLLGINDAKMEWCWNYMLQVGVLPNTNTRLLRTASKALNALNLGGDISWFTEKPLGYCFRLICNMGGV